MTSSPQGNFAQCSISIASIAAWCVPRRAKKRASARTMASFRKWRNSHCNGISLGSRMPLQLKWKQNPDASCIAMLVTEMEMEHSIEHGKPKIWSQQTSHHCSEVKSERTGYSMTIFHYSFPNERKMDGEGDATPKYNSSTKDSVVI